MTTSTEQSIERRIGDVSGDEPGPLLIAVAGLHGNEPAGVVALERVFSRILPVASALSGRFVGLAGNLNALRRGVRFIDLDLNRAWTERRVAALSSHEPMSFGLAEDRDQHELLMELSSLFSSHDGPIYCLDLHTTSAAGGPFATLGDTLKNRAFAMRFPVVKLLGIEEQVGGGLLEWVNRLGHITLGFEGGQHDDPQSIDMHEAFVWQALEHAGLLPARHVPHRLRFDAMLSEASAGLPPVIEVRHRHLLRDGDGFRMEPGWRHFQRVEKGAVLARDAGGPIRALESGYLLMPLYQGQGDDGFFLGRAINPVWLGLSTALRNAGAPNLAHWLPGVRRKEGDPTTVLIDRRVARWQTTEIFHLLGYRRVQKDGPVLEFKRRLE